MNTLFAMVAVLGALGGLMAGVRALQLRQVVGAESGRKIVHVGMGLVCLPCPWLFADAKWVWLLAVLATAMLAAVRLVPELVRRYGGVLGGVSRSSLGDLSYPFGMALAFSLAHERPAAFCAGAAVLALGDAAGAVIGNRWGRSHYPVPGSEKSLEGSAGVWFVSLVCLAITAILLEGTPWPAAAGMALVIGSAAMIVEAVSPLGLDNLTLPPAVSGLWLLWGRGPDWQLYCFRITALACFIWAGALMASMRLRKNRNPPLLVRQ
jgi:phytol kinase